MQAQRFDVRLSPTPQGWVDTALADPQRLLSDHAHCEKKAALTALSLLNAHPGDADLVHRLARLAEQETNHLRRVLDGMDRLGYGLLPDGGNPYAKALLSHCRPGDLADRLLVAAMIEARSHERLSLLAVAVAADPDLAFLEPLLDELVVCEQGHAQTYARLAAGLLGDGFEERLSEWIDHEREAIGSVPHRPAVH